MYILFGVIIFTYLNFVLNKTIEKHFSISVINLFFSGIQFFNLFVIYNKGI